MLAVLNIRRPPPPSNRRQKKSTAAPGGISSSAAPRARSTFSRSIIPPPASRSTTHGEYNKGTHEVTFPKFSRYIADAADMARIIRGEKETDFPYAHDLTVQQTVLQASGVSA